MVNRNTFGGEQLVPLSGAAPWMGSRWLWCGGEPGEDHPFLTLEVMPCPRWGRCTNDQFRGEAHGPPRSVSPGLKPMIKVLGNCSLRAMGQQIFWASVSAQVWIIHIPLRKTVNFSSAAPAKFHELTSYQKCPLNCKRLIKYSLSRFSPDRCSFCKSNPLNLPGDRINVIVGDKKQLLQNFHNS